VLGDVGQPDLVQHLGVEVPVDVIVVDRRAGRLAVAATLADDAGGDVLQRTQPVHPVLRGPVACGLELVGDEPVAELGIVDVDVDDGVHEVRVVPIPLRHGVGTPLVEPLGREPQDPAGHRDGDPVIGKVKDQRASRSFWGRVLREVGRGPAKDLDLLLEHPVAALQCHQLVPSCWLLVVPSTTPSSMLACFSQRWTECSEIPKSVAICAWVSPELRATCTTSRLNFRRVTLRYIDILPVSRRPTLDVNQTLGTPGRVGDRRGRV